MSDDAFGSKTYTVGPDYEGLEDRNYQPCRHLDYVADGYLKPVTKQG